MTKLKLSLVAFLVLGISVLAEAPRPAPRGDAPTEGGLVNPLDNKTEVATPLPESRKFHNVGGTDGLGLCVFASITYCGRYVSDPEVSNLFDKMKHEKGGGWPEKVDAMMKKYCPHAQYIQSTTADYELLKLAIKTGRPCGVTYAGMDSHYRGQAVSHMVQLVYADDNFACISDNNFPGDKQYMWMSKAAFLERWKARGGGWCVILLNTPPPPPPHN